MRSRDWLKGALFGFGLTAAIGAGAAAVAHERHRTGQVAVDKDLMTSSLNTALDDLARIERLNDRNMDRRVKGRIHQGIHDLRAELQGIQGRLDEAPDVDGMDGRGRGDDDRWGRWGDDEQAVSYALTDAEVSAIIRAMDSQVASASKIAIVRDAVSGRTLTTAQLELLMDELAYSNDRVDLAAMLYPSISDQGSFYDCYNHLPFDADRASLRQRLNVR